MMYVPLPQKLNFFQKVPRSKKALFVNMGLDKSIFTGQIYFHWPIFFFTGRIYFVKYLRYVPVPQKLIFFPKNTLLKKGFVCQCGTGVGSMNWLGTIWWAILK